MSTSPEPLTGPVDPVDATSPVPPAVAADVSSPATAGADAAHRRRLVRLLVVVSIVVFGVDQLTKVWAVAQLVPGERTSLLGDLLGLTIVHNPGAALSIATGMTWVLTIVACVVAVVIVRASRQIGSRGWALALGLLLGGALGNLADRMLREPGVARGEVVDFIAYGSFFVGNVADIAIVVAACLIVLLSLRGIRIDGRREADLEPADTSTDGSTDV